MSIIRRTEPPPRKPKAPKAKTEAKYDMDKIFASITLPERRVQPLEGPECIKCGDTVAFYEMLMPVAICLWCEKSEEK